MGYAACSARAADTPSSPGISTSSSATSGLVRSAAATTSSPRPTSATTSKSGSRSSSAASAPRTRAWSSASSSRIVGHAGTSTVNRSPRPAPPGAGGKPRPGRLDPLAAAPAGPARTKIRRPHPRRPDSRRRSPPACSAVISHPAVIGSAVPDHVRDALSDRPGEDLAATRWRPSSTASGRQAVDAGGLQRRARGRDLPRQRDPPHAQRRGPDVGQRVAATAVSRSPSSCSSPFRCRRRAGAGPARP